VWRGAAYRIEMLHKNKSHSRIFKLWEGAHLFVSFESHYCARAGRSVVADHPPDPTEASS
jgi:hypothetical protein